MHPQTTASHPTSDKDREMARRRDLAEHCGIDICLAEGHSPWQPPTHHNGNSPLRRYFEGA